LKRLQEERQAIIDAGDPEPPPPDRRGRDPDDNDIANGSPDLREQVQNLESIVRTQSQEVFELWKAYSDMYSFLTQMWSSGYSAAAMPDMPPPPPPPPPARSQSPPPQPDQGTGSP
ncbi:hypothetical protein PIB30_085079, partial [Stylosanthes scabra]|nr:hypothetical protein [Stylosanthes scabra]